MRTVFDSKGVADESVEIQFGPNIKDWPAMVALTDNLMLKVVSEIHDPVTTTDELIPSGETSLLPLQSSRSCRVYTLPQDPNYVRLAKEVQEAEKAREEKVCPVQKFEELEAAWAVMKTITPDAHPQQYRHWKHNLCGEAGDGSARAGGKLPEGAWRLGEYRKRVCDQALPLEPDQLGNAAISYQRRRAAVQKISTISTFRASGGLWRRIQK